ncbi:MAG: alkaline phosphatase family protein [Acidobacteriota bacterium]
MPGTRKTWTVALIALAAAGTLLALVLTTGLLRPTPRRVIVVGLDAADWQLLDPYIAAGRMPNLARLVREGRSGVLRSIKPPLSPLVWTTMVTGTSPLRHRILDFLRFNPETGEREPITSDERMEKAVWEMANDAGRDVAVLGLWATHPAEPVRGLIVSDRLFAFLRREDVPPLVVHPPEEWTRLLDERARIDREVSLAALQAYLPWLTADDYERLEAGGNPYAHPVTMLRRILIETRLYHRLAVDWVRRRQPALSFVYFQGTDSIGHVFAAYAPPRQPEVTPDDFERYRHVAEAYFAEIDGLLGEYRALADESGSTLLVVSDHGFLWREGRPTHSDSLAGATAALWHREEGIYLVWGPGIEPDPVRGDGRVGQVAATIMALLGLPRAAGTESPALAGVPEIQPARDYGGRTHRQRTATSAPAGDSVERLKALGYVGAGEPATRPESAGASTRTAGSYNNEGSLLLQEKRTVEAKAAFEQALRVDPHLAPAKYNLAALAEAAGESGVADALLLGALADGLGDGPARVEEIVRGALQQGDAMRARRLLDGALTHRPESAELRIARGRMRIERGDCLGALEDFDRARQSAPGLAQAHGLAGSALMCLGRSTEARQAFERSLALDPTQSRLRELLARDRR